MLSRMEFFFSIKIIKPPVVFHVVMRFDGNFTSKL